MNENETPTKTDKVIAFLKKHEHKFDLVATAAIALGSGILIMGAVVNRDERNRWDRVENNDFFKDADVITRDRKGEYYSIKTVDQEVFDNA